jgi:hypothetical protein
MKISYTEGTSAQCPPPPQAGRPPFLAIHNSPFKLIAATLKYATWMEEDVHYIFLSNKFKREITWEARIHQMTERK